MSLTPIRRVVTGKDAQGRSKVQWDGPAPNQHEASLGSGRGHTDIWVWHETPLPINSPNDDGNNDYFQLFGNLPGLKNLSIMIFDRWGEKVFESDDINFKWDGTYKGEKVQPNVYVYVLKLVFLDGHSDNTKKGSITIVR